MLLCLLTFLHSSLFKSLIKYGQTLLKGKWDAATKQVLKWFTARKRLGTPELVVDYSQHINYKFWAGCIYIKGKNVVLIMQLNVTEMVWRRV